ncbi:hypothetical protein CCACVL1_24763 [Corchorus capsularis]|uniref:Uncharacterized protein n=1 Tax=Corchorus capsularis TaxID=210143 RepID=A0A1R3GN64_COCAP|nr:hypothetical protein CCACVL1_24763 [Corchorus capsularis]
MEKKKGGEGVAEYCGVFYKASVK